MKGAIDADPPIQALEADQEVCGWGSLPLELKEIIWGQCSLAQLARVAITCREFCAHLRTLRSTLKTLTVPPGEDRLTPCSTCSDRCISTTATILALPLKQIKGRRKEKMDELQSGGAGTGGGE